MLITIISTVVGLSVLILVHELGHFFAAKAVNIQVPRFSLGFGKSLAGFRIGETEFVLSAIPLGGYVKMAGMDDDEAAEALEGPGAAVEEVDPERTFDSKSIPARVLVISAGVIMNMIFALLVMIGVYAAYGEPQLPITRVSVPPAQQLTGSSRALATIPDGATLTHVGTRPVSTWNEIVYALKDAPAGPVTLRFARAAPATLNLPAPGKARSEMLSRLTWWQDPVLGEINTGTPAARSGLQSGDRVVRAAGQPVASWPQLVSAIQGHPGKPLPLVVQRRGRQLSLTVTPAAERGVDAAGQTKTVGKIGAAVALPNAVHRPVGFGQAIQLGAQETWIAVKLVTGVLKGLLTGALSPRNMGGLLSIGEASGQTAQMGLEAWLRFVAFFSVNLAVLNLLPIPILDGGHLMFLGFEAVRGRPLSVEARVRLSQVGLMIVVALMLWANGNDVVRLIFNR